MDRYENGAFTKTKTERSEIQIEGPDIRKPCKSEYLQGFLKAAVPAVYAFLLFYIQLFL
jgi:hypothetical protein